jgi:hypothetical protein
LVLFAIVDDHVHLWLVGDAAALSRAVRAMTFLLRAQSNAAVEPAYVELIRRRSHAEALVPYLLTQTTHHGAGGHPATASGMAAADLLGARDIGWAPRLWDVLPRLVRREVHAAVGLPPVELSPATDAHIARFGLERMVVATAAAFGAPTTLMPNTRAAQLAVAVAWHLGAKAGFSQQEVAGALGRSRTTLWRSAEGEPVAPKAVRTARLRIALENALADAPATVVAPPPYVLGADGAPAARTRRRSGAR